VNHRADASGKPPEKQFLKRIHESIAAKATTNLADRWDDGVARSSTWTPSHTGELQFQVSKRHKREVDAQIHGMLLPGEQTEYLRHAAEAEVKRQVASLKDRLNQKKKYENRTTAVPPTIQELKGCKVYFDDRITMPREWLATLSQIRGTMVSTGHEANLFVSSNPRAPNNDLITLAACLRGSWIVSPSFFASAGPAGPSIKYESSLMTRRSIWPSQKFREDFPRHWLCILEILTSTKKPAWTILGTPENGL